MYNPKVTYRLQFHKEFTFKKFQEIISYLSEMGISTIYASPVFTSVPGSNHGYDGVNPHQINPEIGTEEELRNISNQLKSQNIDWLQDIVPNHMAFDYRNKWLMDLLENGSNSQYVSFFDCSYSTEFFSGPLMVPFLGSSLEEVIEKGELKITPVQNKLFFQYYESYYPLKPGSALINGEKPLEESINDTNNNKELLKQIANEQNYRLCSWQETNSKINYRRFFTVNSLICMAMQNKEVFNEYHQFILQLTKEKIFSGLRIDHIDGLYDPSEYLARLRNSVGDEVYIVVEKILEPGEYLPDFWPVQGTTGYDFLAQVNNLLTNKQSEDAFSKFYESIIGNHESIQSQVLSKKEFILRNYMNGELDNLYNLFINSDIIYKQKFSKLRKEDICEVIAEFLINCPVYRYYGQKLPLEGLELIEIKNILNAIKQSEPRLSPAVSILEHVLIEKPEENNKELNEKILNFYKRCMQFTGPLMAKGVEDTLMYTYNRFIAHNEVGDNPVMFGISVEEFHNEMLNRLEKWPMVLNATSTHDTKRGEDVRARLNVLTDLTDEWIALVKEWMQQHSEIKLNNAPSPNDEYFIYQTIVGSHPMPSQTTEGYTERLIEYFQKALRESKQNSDWSNPDTEYENNVAGFVKRLIADESKFYSSFSPFLSSIADHGIINSLTQLLLKFTCPGMADIYQGCELWDLSLVDPDNRRPVDFTFRASLLKEINERKNKELFDFVKQKKYEGGIKLWMVKELSNLRKELPSLFLNAEYIPLETGGTYKDHLIAFARKSKDAVLVVVAPIHTALISKEQQKEVWDLDWKDTHVIPPKDCEKEWEDIFNKDKVNASTLVVNDLFVNIPFSILKSKSILNERSAGLLLHLSSLPSTFGIGDMGPEAYSFVSFLNKSRQKLWQLLPLNPTEEGQGHSPYSSVSSRAGNILFISPELLQKENLLTNHQLQEATLDASDKINYRETEKTKRKLLDSAWETYNSNKLKSIAEEFEQFISKEDGWLNDFALYMLLKERNKNKPWYEWEENYKNRDESTLKAIIDSAQDELNKIKWFQFIFFRQWHQLKSFCNQSGIQLIGDLPFYISYDSADVWANREIFDLDNEGNRLGMAGVPPDAFSDDGQLWGMPVFKWDILKEQNYKWWIERFKKNMELFDIIRLDHFRAFAAFWNVPAGEQTARNGQWMPGPGSALFEVVQKELGSLPFIAEDLGEIDDAVYALRDKYNFPGMKVLQFAFGEDMPVNPYIPHNYTPNFIVYTGTHDNNTTLGWCHQEGKDDVKRLESYEGMLLTENTVPEAMCRLAFSSVAKTAIIPVQDILGLDEHARMNIPSSGADNWGWRLIPGQLTNETAIKLNGWTELYNRL